MDRISVLPKTILHDILRRLPNKDAAKTSVLSKSWRETWFSFPIFNLLELPLSPEDPLWLSKLDIFTEHVSKRLRTLQDQGLAVKELKLYMEYLCDNMLVPQSHHIGKWIQMASESGVEVLELYHTHSMDKFYNLPLCLAEAKALTKLVLSGGIRLDPAFLNHLLKFFSVKTLSFGRILLGDERVLEHFISHCPLIEHLTLIHCRVYKPLSVGDPPGSMTYYVKSLSLHGLQKLKRVEVHGIEEVYIDAPNLENLCYHAGSVDASFKLNLGSYKNLRWLSLYFVRRADLWLLERLPKIPFLEGLILKRCSLSERINISIPQLKFFKLSSSSDLKEVNIDAPNLLSCEYFGNGKPVISFSGISNQLEVIARIIVNKHVDRLRQFIQNIEPQEVLKSLSLFIIQPYSIIENLGILQGSSSPPSIKHMQLCIISGRQTHYFPLMNWLLSSCFPETISFSLHRNLSTRAFMVYFYEMLMGSKKGECYCYSRGPECWWHGLKVVKITHLERTYDNVEDLKAMLNALPLSDSYSEECITFTLEL